MGFRISKILPDTGNRCGSCGKPATYEVKVNANGTQFNLCQECSWVLSEALDKTTSTDFKDFETE